MSSSDSAQQSAFSDRDLAALQSMVDALNGRSRKARQNAAHAVAQVARVAPEVVAPFAGEVVGGVDCPEAQTRWEVIDALTSIVAVDPEAAALGFDGAQDSLYDEESPLVRLTAFKYFAALGSASPQWSVKAWPILDEAIQALHGDPGFGEMLGALVPFAQSDLDPAVRAALVERMTFDARNGRGGAVAQARQVIDAAQ